MILKINAAEYDAFKEIVNTQSPERYHRYPGSHQIKGTSYEVQLDKEISLDELEAIAERLKKKNLRSAMQQINLQIRIAKDVENTKISRINQVSAAVEQWLANERTKGWIFTTNEPPQPYLVKGVTYERETTNTEARVRVKLDINRYEINGEKNYNNQSTMITIYKNDLPATIGEIMQTKGWQHEAPELHEEYDRNLERFTQIVAQPNEQFRLKPGTYKHRYQKSVITNKHRVINDETLLIRHIRIPDQNENGFQREIPQLLEHHVYNLETHEHMSVPTSQLEDYVYDPDAASKIVLPDDHRDLIDLLTEDASIILDDVVENKTGGTLILLEGRAGLGKTLLAQIYAEKIRRPLYQVQAGQLGINAERLEKKLATAYENATRWNAVMLIDEADIYIRERDNDIEHNAVVATMLISFERQNTLTFLATNRVDDIDEAVRSRCIAIVRFRHPNPEEARRIWQIQTKVLNLNLDDAQIDQLVAHYHQHDDEQDKPRISGRDIRALLKLAKRYESSRGRIDAETVIKLAAFKGF